MNRTVKAERGPLALRCGGSFGALPLLTEGLAAPATAAAAVQHFQRFPVALAGKHKGGKVKGKRQREKTKGKGN